MHDVAVARLHLDRLHPAVFGEVRLHDHGLVGHDPCRLHTHRLGKLEDRVGRADQPAVGIRPGRRCVGRISLGAAPREPGHEIPLLGLGERPIVGPRRVHAARLGVGRRGGGEPGGHCAAVDHLPHHRRVGHQIVEGVERKRPHAAIAVALHAVPRDDPRDPAVVGDIRGGRIARGRVEHAPRGLGGGHGWLLAGPDRGQRVGEVTLPWGVERVAEAVLVVDRAVVGDRPVGPEHDDVGGGDRTDRRRQPALRVGHVDRPLAKPVCRGPHVGGLVARHGIDEHPGDASAPRFGEPLERGQILAAERATRARHGEDHDPVGGERGQRVPRAREVGERDIADSPADAVITGPHRLRPLADGWLGGGGLAGHGIGAGGRGRRRASHPAAEILEHALPHGLDRLGLRDRAIAVEVEPFEEGSGRQLVGLHLPVAIPVELVEPLFDRLLGAGPGGDQGGDCDDEQGADRQCPTTDGHVSHRVVGIRSVAWASARDRRSLALRTGTSSHQPRPQAGAGYFRVMRKFRSFTGRA